MVTLFKDAFTMSYRFLFSSIIHRWTAPRQADFWRTFKMKSKLPIYSSGLQEILITK